MRVWKLVIALALVVAACGGDSEAAPTTEAEPEAPATTEAAETTTSSAPEETTPPETTEPEAPTTTAAGGAGSIPDPTSGATLVGDPNTDITAGDVFVYWYRDTASGNYLALYAGPGIAGAAGQMLCPGNSISTPEFQHVSNTPAEDGSCTDFPTDTASLQVCSGDVWLYQTLIPGDVSGVLYGSLEWNADDGSIQGKYSQFDSASDIGEFEFGLTSYDLWEGFTSDGSTTVTCEAPMP